MKIILMPEQTQRVKNAYEKLARAQSSFDTVWCQVDRELMLICKELGIPNLIGAYWGKDKTELEITVGEVRIHS